MAKLTDIPVVTALATDDLVYAVDTSDTTDDPAGSSVAITRANLLSNAAGNATSRFLLEEIALTSAGEFDFNNIPQDYDYVLIEGEIRSTVAAEADAVVALFNEDTTLTNYHTQNNYSSDGTANAGETPTSGLIAVATAASSPANAYASVSIDVMGYGLSSSVKNATGQFTAYYATAKSVTGQRSVSNPSITDPLTRIRIRSSAHPTSGLTGTLRLIGVRAVSLEDSETITVKQEVPVVLSGGEFTIDLTDYQGGDRVIIEGNVRSDLVGDIDTIAMQFNGDTTAANYTSLMSRANGATDNFTAYREQSGRCGNVAASTHPAAHSGQVSFTIENYTANGQAASSLNNFSVTDDAGDLRVGQYHTNWLTTDAVTSIKILSNTANNLSGSIKCYIEKQGVLPVTPTVEGIPSNASSHFLIEEITDPGPGGFVFSNIPQDYDRIEIRGQVRTTEAITAARVLVNGDVSDAGYHQQINAAYNGTNLVTEGAKGTFSITSSTGPAGHYGSLVVAVEGYSESLENMVTVETSSHYGVAQVMKGFYAIGTNDNTPLTEIKIEEHDGTGEILGTLQLIGVRAVSLESSETITVKQEVPVVYDGTKYDIDLSNYQGGENIILTGALSGAAVGGSNAVELIVNGDTVDANYRGQQVGAYAATIDIPAYNSPRIATVSAGAVPDNQGQVDIRINDYTGARKKNAVAHFALRYGAAVAETAHGSIGLETSVTDPVTSLTIQTDNGDALSGDLKCYIEKQGVLPVTPTISEIPSNAASHFLLEEITNTSPGEFDFTVPSGYDRLIVQGHVKSNSAGTVEAVTCFINEELTTADYWYQTISASNGLVNDNEGPVAFAGLCTTDNALPANMQTDISVSFEAPDVPSKTKSYLATVVSGSAAEDVATGVYSTRSPVDAPITRLRFRTDNYPTDQLVGTLQLIGIRTVSLTESETVTVKQEVPVVLSGGEFTVDLTNYQGGDRVIVEGALQSDSGGAATGISAYLNGDEVDANYESQRLTAQNGSVSSTKTANAVFALVPTSASGYTGFGTVEASIENYAATGIKMIGGVTRASSRGSGTAGPEVGQHSVESSITAPVTSLTIKSASALSGSLKCYIEKQGVLPMTTPTVTNLPVVQSATFNGADGAITWQNEAGWSCTRTGLGTYDVTLPTAASAPEAQSIQGSWVLYTSSVNEYFVTVTAITATTCEVRVTSDAGTEDDQSFTLIRRLPDAPAQALVATQPAGTVVREELGRITDPGAGGFVFTGFDPADYDRLYIKGQIKSSVSATIDATEILFNADTTSSNYFYQRIAGLDAATAAPEGVVSRFATVNGATAPVANSITDVDSEIENPNSSSVKSAVTRYRLQQTATAAENGTNATWNPNITVPLTTITVRTDNDPTDTLTGTLILYGERTI